ncbi:MAG: M1 family metallopeptidase [Verrucomicrobia bacterium]|nr:M1 family metallopeptidase [Verrucomicrobiota bacterium]
MRKPIALLLVCFIAAASYGENTANIQTTVAGLPKNVVPRNYLIHMEPNVETRATDGAEAIEIEVLAPTNRIVLNSLDTQITRAKIEGGDRQEQLVPEFDANQQTVWFDLKEVLLPGKYTLSIRFQSGINEQPIGLFIQDCEDRGALPVEPLLATAQQPGNTRRIFPCWDGPAFQATVQLSVRTEKQNTVISNTPIQIEQQLGPDQKIVVFEKTPLIPINMASLVCGKLESLEDEVAGIKLRILTTPGKKELGTFAMEVTKQLLPYLNDYFAIPFPLLKLDQVAFPSAADDSTGIWGEPMCDENALLCDPKTSYESTRQRVFLAIAQKLALRWCTDLVPMNSRSDRWLREGLASWIARKAADHFHPQWKIWLHAALDKESVMAFDAGDMTQAIQPGTHAEGEASNASDVLLSQKPWLLLRMLENFSGEDAFREGVRGYLAAHKTSETTSEDLWGSLERATRRPIKKMMVAWTEQPGFPLIKVTTRCVNGNRVISLEQVPFILARGGATPLQWGVPVGIRTTTSPNEVKYALLDKLSNSFDLVGCGGVLQANAGNAGYFRVLYEPALFNDLRKNVQNLPESDRLCLSTDTWALVESGNQPATSYLDLLEDLRRDDSFAFWQCALGAGETLGALKLIDHLEQGRPGREAYQKYICSLFAPKLQVLGWDESTGENAETGDYRAMLIETLGFFGDRDVIDKSFKRFEDYRENPDSLAPNLRAAVIAIVGRYSSESIAHELLSMAANTWSEEEKRMYLRALGAALDPALAKETLQYLISEKVKPGDASMALEYFAANCEHPNIAWSFAVANFKQMQERFGSVRQSRWLSLIAAGFSDDQRADEVLAFGKANLPPSALHELETAVDQLQFRAKLKVKTLPTIDAWIKANLERTRKSASRDP